MIHLDFQQFSQWRFWIVKERIHMTIKKPIANECRQISWIFLNSTISSWESFLYEKCVQNIYVSSIEVMDKILFNSQIKQFKMQMIHSKLSMKFFCDPLSTSVIQNYQRFIAKALHFPMAKQFLFNLMLVFLTHLETNFNSFFEIEIIWFFIQNSL